MKNRILLAGVVLVAGCSTVEREAASVVPDVTVSVAPTFAPLPVVDVPEKASRATRSRTVVTTLITPEPTAEPVEERSTIRSSGGLNWAALAECESGGNPRAVNPSGKYHGLYQFDRSTWASVGGSGVASDASAAEQTRRAAILYSRRGSSPWPHCGRYL